MSFYTHLENLGAGDLILPPRTVIPSFIKMDEIVATLHKFLKERKRVAVIRDYDPDGMYGGEIAKESFEHLGFINFFVVPYTKRTHDIDTNGVLMALKESADLVIIIDTGSSELGYARKIRDLFDNVIIIDHHESVYSYEDYEGINIINTTMERKAGGEFEKLSAAALTYLVFSEYFKFIGQPEPLSLSVLALCSMYSDSIDMSSNIARLIYKRAVNVDRRDFPKLVKRFMNEKTPFHRRFIEFQLNPPINSLFRSESFSLLNILLDWKPMINGVAMSDIIDTVRNTYEFYRNEVSKISDIIMTKNLGEFVVGDLSSVIGHTELEYSGLHNYTGLVANTLSSRHNKPAIVYGDSGIDIKCSLRDYSSRNLLDVFRRFSKANGHNSAFAISVPYRGLNDFLQYVTLIESISESTNEPIVLDFSLEEPSEPLIRDMAVYNEFAGNHFPLIYISRIWSNSIKRRHGSYSSYYKEYDWNKYLRVKSRVPLRPYSKVIMRPYKSKVIKGNWIPELKVERVIG